MAWLLANVGAPRRRRSDSNEATTIDLLTCFIAQHGKLVKLVVLCWKGLLSALQNASFALFDSLGTSQKSDSSAKMISLVSYDAS